MEELGWGTKDYVQIVVRYDHENTKFKGKFYS